MKIKERTGRLTSVLVLSKKKLDDPYYQGAVAELAFFFLMAIVPVFILLSQLLGIFSISLDSIKGWIDTDLVFDGAEMLLSVFDYSPSGVNSLFLAATALWAASRAQFAILRITNYTMTDGHTTGEGYIRDRLRALQSIAITIFTIGFSLAVLVYGEFVLKLIFGFVAGTNMAEATWIMIRWPIAAVLYFLMISYNYYFLPTHRIPYRAIVPGSIFAAVGLLLVTVVFNVYASISAGYDILYGSFSNIVALMFWFYLMSWVMLLGIVLNRTWWETKEIQDEMQNEI